MIMSNLSTLYTVLADNYSLPPCTLLACDHCPPPRLTPSVSPAPGLGLTRARGGGGRAAPPPWNCVLGQAGAGSIVAGLLTGTGSGGNLPPPPSCKDERAQVCTHPQHPASARTAQALGQVRITGPGAADVCAGRWAGRLCTRPAAAHSHAGSPCCLQHPAAGQSLLPLHLDQHSLVPVGT